jgi:hypothetical protein
VKGYIAVLERGGAGGNFHALYKTLEQSVVLQVMQVGREQKLSMYFHLMPRSPRFIAPPFYAFLINFLPLLLHILTHQYNSTSVLK